MKSEAEAARKLTGWGLFCTPVPCHLQVAIRCSGDIIDQIHHQIDRNSCPLRDPGNCLSNLTAAPILAIVRHDLSLRQTAGKRMVGAAQSTRTNGCISPSLKFLALTKYWLVVSADQQ